MPDNRAVDNRIILYPQGSVADPAHVIWWYKDGAGSSGTVWQRILIRLLARSVRKHIGTAIALTSIHRKP